MKLLIVEDEERLASFLTKGLRAHGYTIEWAQNCQDALRRLTHPGISHYSGSPCRVACGADAGVGPPQHDVSVER